VGVGAGIGGAIAAAAGATVSTGMSLGGVIAGSIAFSLGLIGSLYLVGWNISFNSSVPNSNLIRQTQDLKLTNSQSLPETTQTVTVVPNDYKVSELGTTTSAKVIGPASTMAQPYVVVEGGVSVNILTPPPPGGDGAAPTPPPASAEAEASLPGEGQGLATLGNSVLATGSGATPLQPRVVGELSLHYHVVRVNGMQGILTYLWTFRGKPVGTAAELDVTLPLTADMLSVGQLEFNKVTFLGKLKLTVTDSFDRVAVWEGSISLGHAKDLRLFARQQVWQPDFIDPMGIASQRGLPPERLTQVAWAQAEQGLAGAEGQLLSYTSFQSPLSGEPLAVVTAAQTY
jgi:hypothetical protein